MKHEGRFSFRSDCRAAKQPGKKGTKMKIDVKESMAAGGSPAQNMRKYESYKLAFDMIDEGIAGNCPLQSIAVEESILTDRISSTLNAGKQNASPANSLGHALRQWHPQKGSPDPNSALFDEKMEELFPRLDDWRKERNALLHAIVKSAQGDEPETPASEFLLRAMKAAKDGLALVRKVDKWTKRQIRKAVKVNIEK